MSFESERCSLQPMSSVDRRDFVKGALIGGFAAATIPVSATTIQTNTEGLEAGEVAIPIGQEKLPAYRARPLTGGDWPLVIVVQEIFGVHEHIRDVCRRLAKLGAYAIAPELFFRQGNPGAVTDMQTLMREIVARVPDAQVMSDLDATLAWSRDEGATGKAGITGFCWGGRITWLYAAHSDAIAAGVAWYGRLVGQASELQPVHPVDVAARLRAPVLGLYAGEDAGIPQDSVAAMRSALQAERVSAAAKGSSITVYPQAKHGFHADYRAAYRPEDAQPAFFAACAFFRQHGLALQNPA
jgi:carboxymethylenebutenolidase